MGLQEIDGLNAWLLGLRQNVRAVSAWADQEARLTDPEHLRRFREQARHVGGSASPASWLPPRSSAAAFALAPAAALHRLRPQPPRQVRNCVRQ